VAGAAGNTSGTFFVQPDFLWFTALGREQLVAGAEQWPNCHVDAV
jgi:hypothetical protein